MKKQLLRPILATMIFCIAIFAAVTVTAQAASVKEKLPDGSYIVTIDGADYKALPPSTLKDIVNASELANGELDKCRQARANLEKQIAVYEQNEQLMTRDRDLAGKEAALQQERALRFSAMYTLEHDLRLKSESVNARGSVSKFFDKPAVQLVWKAGIPAFQTYLSARCN